MIAHEYKKQNFNIYFFSIIQGDEEVAFSEKLETSFGGLKVAGGSYVFSPETGSTASSSGNGAPAITAKTASGPRETLNAFLNQCQIEPLGRPWADWDNVSLRTRQRFTQRSSEIVSTVLRVISPVNAPQIWNALQSSNIVNQQLGVRQAHLSVERPYLEALAEA